MFPPQDACTTRQIRPFPKQYFQPITATRAEQEQVAIHRILIRDDLGQLRQTIKPTTHVRWRRRQPNARRGRAVQRRERRQADHAIASSLRINSINNSWSNPRRASSRRPPCTHISIAPTADVFRAFTSTNAGADERFDRAGERNRRFQA